MSTGRLGAGDTAIQPTILDAKGDLIVATAADTPARLAVGSNNQVLMADSSQSTGVKWGASAASTLTATGDLLYASAANTPARLGIGSTDQVLKVSGGVPVWGAAPSPTGAGVLVNASSGTTVPSATYTTINWNSEIFDTDNFHSNTTNNSRLTIPAGLGGLYQVSVNLDYYSTVANVSIVRVLKNGNEIVRAYYFHDGNSDNFAKQLDFPYQLVATDYLEVQLYQQSGANRTAPSYGTFGIARIGA